MTKDVIDAIKERRSVRKFTQQEVSDATISRIIEAALWAPSAGNIQPWNFYVVKGTKTKEKISQAALNQKAIIDAPFSIVVCANLNQARAKYGARGENLYSLQDTAAAIQNMLLAATGFGLGSLWVGAFDEEEIANILELEEGNRPVAIITLGFAEFEPNAPARKSLEDVVHVIED